METKAAHTTTLSGQQILDALEQHMPRLRSMGVRKIGLFGSHSRGAATTASDIDILLVLNEPTFDSYMDVRFLLEDLFSRKVDLVLESDVKPRLLPHILAEVIYAT